MRHNLNMKGAGGHGESAAGDSSGGTARLPAHKMTLKGHKYKLKLR